MFRRAYPELLAALLPVLVLPQGCAGSSNASSRGVADAGDQGDGMETDSGIGPCPGTPATCEEIASQQPTNYMPGVSGPAPTGFPAAPPGAVFCGSFSNTTPEVGAVYLFGTLSQSDVFEYYSSALVAQGFSIPAPTTLAVCVEDETFMMISGGPFCGGGIVLDGAMSYFRVTYAEYCGSCEANGASCADDIDCCTDRCVGVANGVAGTCG